MHHQRWRTTGSTGLRTIRHVVACAGCGVKMCCAGTKPRKWCDACKKRKTVERVAAWQREHPDRKRSYERQSAQKARDAGTAWYQRHPEKASASRKRHYTENRECYIEKARQWVEANRDAARRIRQQVKRNRRARELGAVGRFTVAEFLALCEARGWRCAYCGCDLTAATATRDHIVPLKLEGRNDIGNIAPACLRCNKRKGARTPEQWAEDEAVAA